MHITAVTCHPVQTSGRPQLLVRVDTDEGIYGWGESGISGRERAVMGAIDHFTPFLLGKDPMRAGALWQEMYRGAYFEGGRVLTAAISAIDIALYDIKGKALGVPVYELLGGAQRDRIPTFATTPLERAQNLIDLGWNCLRLGITGGSDWPGRRGSADGPPERGLFEPSRSVPATAAALVHARKQLGSDVILGIDYHHRLSVAEAAQFCNRMPAGTLDFLEEPIRDESPGSYRALRAMVDVPFAIGEEFASKWQFLPYLEGDLTQYARVDICNVGGFTEAMKVAGWAEAHYVDLMPHNPLGPVCTAATIHLCAAVANMAWMECRETPGENPNLFDTPLYRNRPLLDGPDYPLPTAPGLGIDVDTDVLASSGVTEWTESPHLHKSDGSYTNW
jgi:galactonate dehydratase